MAENLGSEYIVDIIEATISPVGTGSHEQALQVMLPVGRSGFARDYENGRVRHEKYADEFNEVTGTQTVQVRNLQNVVQQTPLCLSLAEIALSDYLTAPN